MSDCKRCQCQDKSDTKVVINNNLSICFFTILAPGNTFDPTRQGFIVTNAQNLTLGPIQTRCKVIQQCGCTCEEQQCATLTGNFYWTVSIPILSLCAAPGSNTGFQSVSGVKRIDQEICGDLSNFNPCTVTASIIEIKLQPDPCHAGSTLPNRLVGGIVANPPDHCDCTFTNGNSVRIPNELGNCQDSCDNLVFNQM